MVIDHHDHDHDPPNGDHLKKDKLFDSIELLIVIDEAHPLPVVLHLHLIIGNCDHLGNLDHVAKEVEEFCSEFSKCEKVFKGLQSLAKGSA